MFTQTDRDLLTSRLGALEASGVVLAPGIERDDLEDELCDDLDAFRSAPLSSLALLADPDGAAMLRGVSLEAFAEAACLAHGTRLLDFVVFPDPGSAHAGSLRLRMGTWDVFDIGYDLAAEDAPAREVREIEALAARPR